MIDTVSQFIIIILIFLAVSDINRLVLFSNTILGKLLAVGLIVFYTSIDTLVGLFVCGLVILFYQSDYVDDNTGWNGRL